MQYEDVNMMRSKHVCCSFVLFLEKDKMNRGCTVTLKRRKKKGHKIYGYTLFPYLSSSKSGSVGARHFPLWRWADHIPKAWCPWVFQSMLTCLVPILHFAGILWLTGKEYFGKIGSDIHLLMVIYFLLEISKSAFWWDFCEKWASVGYMYQLANSSVLVYIIIVFLILNQFIHRHCSWNISLSFINGRLS